MDPTEHTVEFVADLHIHSRFARATSKGLNPQSLYTWACLKGLRVLGTGDFTHPEWLSELKEQLEPAEEGLYRLRDEFRRGATDELPVSCRREMRFVLSSEISLIYKKDEKTRKVHHLVLMPSFEAADRMNARLEQVGNLKSDGRPILGFDSRDLVELCVEACEEVLFIPAHIWTPHFAVLGASSGFDTLEACFGDMLPHIFAVETGLSSDPPMNWRLSMLDDYAIVSNSDAHSPQKLAREATCFSTECTYAGMYAALKTRDASVFRGTLEFYPEEGKYHLDGHRKCGVCLEPRDTIEAGGLCPACGKKLTVGVLHRVEALSDRPEGTEPASARPFERLIPLPEVISSSVGVGPTSKRVQGIYERMLDVLGPELEILRSMPVEDIAACGEPVVAEGLRRMRVGEVHAQPGYDGAFGEIRVFLPGEQAACVGQAGLFPDRLPPPAEQAARVADRAPPDRGPGSADVGALHVRSLDAGPDPRGLDRDQQRAVVGQGPIAVVAGPGSGKTRVLTERAAYLVREAGVVPSRILAVTFTNRAAAEMRRRIGDLLPGAQGLPDLRVGTFHSVALDLLAAHRGEGAPAVVGAAEARQILSEALADADISAPLRGTASAISLAKSQGVRAHESDPELREAYLAYQARLSAYGVADYDDILLGLASLLESRGGGLGAARNRWDHLLVDEFQDVNPVQYQIVRKLGGDGSGLFVIGDPHQAIYGFRGASAALFECLLSDYPETATVRLDRTYRSTPEIAAAASAVISAGTGAGRSLRSERESGAKVRHLVVSGETAEGIAVVREINRLVGGADMLQADGAGGRVRDIEGGADWSLGDFAVLFRTGRQADALEACFLEEGLPYRVVGQRGFLESEPVLAALRFFRFAFRPDRDLQFLDALALPQLGLGGETLRTLRRQCAAGALPDPLPPDVEEKVDLLVRHAERYRALSEEEEPGPLLDRWGTEFRVSESPEYSRFVELASRAESVDALLDSVLLGQDGDLERSRRGPRTEAVTLMTLHAAKGLEFPVVFICGVEEGLVPLSDRDAELQEERRLFYVGLTRAKDEVLLLSARSRLRYGKRERPEVSRFVCDIPSGLLCEANDRQERRVASQLALF